MSIDVGQQDLHPSKLICLAGQRRENASTAYYDESRFARDGVVCVTISYRVGAEGFLYLGDGVANLGLIAYGLPAQGLSAYRAANPGASAGELFSTIQTDWYRRIPAVRLADAHAASAAQASTYMYDFAWRFGAAHGGGSLHD
jgi:carboxylesterase type B